jgi:hypothetical protein
MSKENIPPVVLPSVTGILTLLSRRRGGSELAAHAVFPANKTAAAAIAGPQYFLIKACRLLCCLNISSLIFLGFRQVLHDGVQQLDHTAGTSHDVNAFLTLFCRIG